jgi:hypothetical protein
VAQHNQCELCLKHINLKGGQCFLAARNGSPPPCGEHGCRQFHHPVLHSQMRGFGGGLNPSWSQMEQQASMVEQQDQESKEDVDIGDMHVQDHVTFSSGYPFNENGETFPIFSGNKATAPPAVEKIFENSKDDEKLIEAFKNCTLKESDSKSMQSRVSSGPFVSARTGSDDCGSGFNTESYKSANFYDADEELENYAASSENIIMLGHTVTLGNKNINLCYDSGAAFSVIHESAADPMYISE